MTTLRSVATGYRYGTTVDVEILDCAKCGIPFGVPAAFLDRRRDDGEWFYCPSGHSNVYRDTNEKRLRRQLEKAEADRDYWKRAEKRASEREMAQRRRNAALKGHLTRMRNRIASGVCPVPGCKRTNLTQTKRHIESMHPDWWADHAHELEVD